MKVKTEKPISIREAHKNDIEKVSLLRVNLLKEIGNIKSDADAIEVLEANRRYFSKNYGKDACKIFLAESEGTIIAISTLVRFERPPVAGNLQGLEGHILNIFTVPEWRGKRLAALLLERIISYARQNGYSRLWLDAVPEAVSLYKRMGFVLNHSISTSKANIDMEMFL